MSDGYFPEMSTSQWISFKGILFNLIRGQFHDYAEFVDEIVF
jgi:hypothetical protein